MTEKNKENLLYTKVMEDQDLTLHLYKNPFMFFEDSCKDEETTKYEKIFSSEYQNLEFEKIGLILFIVGVIAKSILIGQDLY